MATYCYSPLPEGHFRLLRLMPDEDEDAPIMCRLLEFNLSSDRRPRLYEALSYVWGSEEKPRLICINDRNLPVGENLHVALLHLRDRFFERALWVDAICIDQENRDEKEEQVPLIAMIYANARGVVVWLGETADDSNQALETIRIAAARQHRKSSESEENRQAVIALLQRQWFQRIWVLQEVAAAQHVLIKCGYAEIDGYAFCSGLGALNFAYLKYPNIYSLFQPISFLIRDAAFRLKYAQSRSGRFSLDISPMSHLVDMYHTRKATHRHDKVFALMGMCSDGTKIGAISVNYTTPWAQLFRQIVNLVISAQAAVTTWDDRDFAVMRGKGWIIGKVTSVGIDVALDHRPMVEVEWDRVESKSRLAFEALAKPVEQQDFVCFLIGASHPTIIRLCDDYWAVVVAAVRLPNEAQERLLRPRVIPPEEFLLVWDWETPQIEQKLPSREDYEQFVHTRGPESLKIELETGPEKSTRLWHVAMALRDTYQNEAGTKLQETRCTPGEAHNSDSEDTFRYIATFHEELERHKSSADEKEKWKSDAMSICLRKGDYNQITEDMIIQMMKLKSLPLLRLLISERGDEVQLSEQMVEAAGPETSIMNVLLEEGKNKVRVTNGAIVQIVERFGKPEVGQLLQCLDHQGNKIKITELLLEAAARNKGSGREMTMLLRNWNWNDVRVQEEALAKQAKDVCHDEKELNLFLDQHRDDAQTTEAVLKAVARYSYDTEVMTRLLDRKGCEFHITEAVLQAATGNHYYGLEMMKVLLDRKGNDSQVTEAVLQAATGNQYYGLKMVKVLLDRIENGSQVTEAVLQTAAKNASGPEMMKVLLDRKGNDSQVTEALLQTAAKNASGPEMMKVLLDRIENGSQVTEAVLRAVVKNEARRDIVMLMLDREKDEVLVTEAVLEASAANMFCTQGSMEFLLERRRSENLVTDAVLKAAARSQSQDHIMQVLFNFYSQEKGAANAEVLIAELVIETAAENPKPHSTMKWLLTRMKEGAVDQIIEEVIEVAVRKKEGGRHIMNILWNWIAERDSVDDGSGSQGVLYSPDVVCR